MKRLICAALACLAVARSLAGQQPECQPAVQVPIRVRIAEAGPLAVEARLEGSSALGIRVVAAVDGRLLWSAAGVPPASRLFAGMTAGFAGSLLALDLDGDGLHDRIYAGDLASRLWRFDLHHGRAALAWASGGVLADFSSTAGRAFVAAPDVSLSQDAGSRWFSIAIGTASLPDSTAGNRFYVLRDEAPFESWEDADYARWTPWHERDLVRFTAPPPAVSPPMPHGYFIELEHGQVLMPSITVAGRAVLAIADRLGTAASQCAVAVSVAAVDLEGIHAADTPAGHAAAGDWRRPLPHAVSSSARFELAASDTGEALCTLGNEAIDACSVSTRPQKTWWRRGDAE